MEINQRYSGFAWAPMAEKAELTLVGAGGIGGAVAKNLSKLVSRINLYEIGEVKEQNIGSQIYTKKQLGLDKTVALDSILQEICIDGFSLACHGEFKEGSPVNPITIVCPDNMEARINAFEAWNKLEDKLMFIDGRLIIEGWQVFVVKPTEESIDAYKEHLFPDNEAEELPCTTRATYFVGESVGAHITQMFLNTLAFKDFRVSKSLTWSGRLAILKEI